MDKHIFIVFLFATWYNEKQKETPPVRFPLRGLRKDV